MAQLMRRQRRSLALARPMCAETQGYIDLAGKTFREKAGRLERRLWEVPVA